MAVGAIVAGGALAAAGTAAAIRAAKIDTRAKRQNYGGSQEATQAYREMGLGGIQTGQDQINQGAGLIGHGTQTAQDIGQYQGGQLYGQGQKVQGWGSARMSTGQGYETQALWDAQARARGEGPSVAEAIMQRDAAQASLEAQGLAATARGGNQAAAMRAAVDAGVRGRADVAANAAILRQQEMLAASQQAADMATRIRQSGESQYALGQQTLGMGLGAMQYGADTAISSGQYAQQLGAGREEMYLGYLGDVNSQQLGADMDYDKRRQEARLRKQDRLFALGGSLIGTGGQIAGSAGGGSG